MNKDEALETLKKKLIDDRMIKHSLAVSACMEALAGEFEEDKDKWSLAGLFHDIDYEDTKDRPEEHGIRGAEYLEEFGVPSDILYAIKVHAGNAEPKSRMDIALLTSDALSGLIVASALVNKEGLMGVDTEFVLKRFKEKRFAAGANREHIKKCEEMGLKLDEFISICLKGMKGESDVLGL
jgi:putative nucleotidyltransferase with HDIG domain